MVETVSIVTITFLCLSAITPDPCDLNPVGVVFVMSRTQVELKISV